ncbi:MAG: polysaccharide deacetylase family protein [Coriobacteriales bacterium]|nr:polysaccharide deacetylase family protein [Coriobacteriales bacterium]
MAKDQDSRNPYEDADPIPIPVRSSHAHYSSHSAVPSRIRSRTVQSARDSAPRRQEQINQMRDGASHMRPAHSASDALQSRADAGRSSAARGSSRPMRDARSHQQATGSERRGGYSPYATTTGSHRSVSINRQYDLRTRRKINFGIIAGIIILAIIALAGLLWWINRPVPITVNGSAAEVRVGSTLDDLIHEQKISVAAGNYVSVTGNVLRVEGGNAYTATVNGNTLSASDAAAYRVAGGEAIEYSDGTDVTENYTAEAEQVMPQLRFEGNGYSLQYISQWGKYGERQYRTGEESGESAWVVSKEPQDCIIKCVDPYFPEGDKVVALTFDDGPADGYTAQYLEILARYGVKATFFNLGANTQNYPDIARSVVAAGHELANHTMDHNQLTAVDASTIHDQIAASANVIEQVTGVKTTHIRPPYGDFSQESWLASGGLITASVRWTGDSQDWSTPGVDAIVENALKNVYSGSIILMHDGGGDRSQDVEALPIIIERLQSEGYQFVTIADLMRRIGGISEDVCSGTATMPADAVWPQEIAPDDATEQD